MAMNSSHTKQKIARPAFADVSPSSRSYKPPKNSRRRNRFRVEGLRGAATRQAVALRYLSYWLIIICASVTVHAIFQGIGGAETGGLWLLLSASYQCTIAAIGSIFLAPHRPEISDQLRGYLFGYTVLPALGVAVFLWFAQSLAVNAGSNDIFLGTLVSALPFLYFLPVVIPAIIFTKLVAGYRITSRVQLDDEEILRIYTRNDGYQR